MEALGLILARGGSRGIPRKNLVDLGGKPLIAWTIEAALASNLTRVVVSTDDEEIAAVSRELGAEVPFMRPPRLATDDARSIDVEEHALTVLETVWDYVPDVMVRLQPTSPFRSVGDINAALQKTTGIKGEHYQVIGISPALDTPSLVSPGNFPPQVMDERARQKQGNPWRVNGAVYASNVRWWRLWGWYNGSIGHEMPQERGWDIDTPFDLEVARALVETGRVG